jgi:hypothetical protein
MVKHLYRRLSELDLTDIISGHSALYVQRAILSANVTYCARSNQLPKEA